MGNTPQSSSLANSPVLGAETVNCSSEEFRRRLCDDEGFTSGDHDQIGPSSCTGGGGGGGGGTKDGAPGKAASGWAMPWANAGRGRKVKRAVAPLKTLVVTCEGVNEEVALPKVFALFNVVALQRHLDIGSLVVKSVRPTSDGEAGSLVVAEGEYQVSALVCSHPESSVSSDHWNKNLLHLFPLYWKLIQVISVVILIFVEDPHYEISVILPPQTQNKLRSEWELCDELIVGPRGIAMSLSSDGATPDQCRVCGDFLSKLFSNPNNSMESSKQEDKSIPKYLQNVHKLKSLQHCCGSSAHEILSPVRGDAFAAPQIEFRDGSTASINLFQCIDNPDRCLTIYHHDIFIPLLRHDGGASDPTLTYAAGSRLLGEKWEGGIVPYRIFPNISQYHMVELRSTILLYDLAYAKNKKAGLKRILDQAPVGMGLLQKINQAIVSIQEVCPVRFVLASDESPNCVIILHDKAGPWSQTGKAPTPIQRVALHNNVTVGNIIHELLHTLGLDHTHCRYDRDKYVNVNYEFIDKSNLGDFDKSVNEKEAVGSYDFGSIMHYPRNAFSTSSKPTLEPIPGGVEIGQRKCLSPGDIHTVCELYSQTLHCTFKAKDFVQQPWFSCITCWGPAYTAYGCCFACKERCHAGHRTVELGLSSSFCDCGATNHCYKCTRFSTDARDTLQHMFISEKGTRMCIICAGVCSENVVYEGKCEFHCECDCLGKGATPYPAERAKRELGWFFQRGRGTVAHPPFFSDQYVSHDVLSVPRSLVVPFPSIEVLQARHKPIEGLALPSRQVTKFEIHIDELSESDYTIAMGFSSPNGSHTSICWTGDDVMRKWKKGDFIGCSWGRINSDEIEMTSYYNGTPVKLYQNRIPSDQELLATLWYRSGVCDIRLTVNICGPFSFVD